MVFVVDLVIIAILALCILLGYKRGLTRSLIKILSFVLALIIALILFKPVSDFVINNTQIDDKIKDSVVQIFINEESNNSDNKKDKEETTVAQPIINYMNEQVEKSTEQVKSDAVNKVAIQISVLLVNIGVIILIFIIVRFLLIFVKAITSLITKLPVIKQCDKLGGIAFGAIEGLVIIFMALSIITLIVPITGNYTITKLIGQSIIGSILYNNNLLLEIIF